MNLFSYYYNRLSDDLSNEPDKFVSDLDEFVNEPDKSVSAP